MLRWTVAAAIVIGLLAGIWLLWPREGDDAATTTVPVAGETTTSEGPTTTEPATTTTTVDPTQVREVETVEQAEAILRELWFGWFEGIYNEDEDRIREVVATEEQVETAREAFGTDFTGAPEQRDISFRKTELLRSDINCVAVWTELGLSGFRVGETQDVHVLRWLDGRWVMLGFWDLRDDLWESDCDAAL